MTSSIVQAVINTFLLLNIIFLAFAIKAWFDQRTFRANAFYAQIVQQYETDQMMAELADEEFDRHVETTIGMRHF